jgi:regulator of replication initiation timing
MRFVSSRSAKYFLLVRISVFFLSLFICLSANQLLRAQDPGAQQDAEAAREKLLKAADQLDNIQSNSETTKASVDNMKADVTRLQATVTQLQTDNETLKQQLADLQAAFDKAEAAHVKERQVLIDNIADMIKQSGGSKPTVKKKSPAAGTAPAKPDSGVDSAPATASPSATSLNPPADPVPAETAPADPAPAKPQKGYYHVVASGETLRLICNAYKQDGVNVTVSDIQKANGLTDKSVLKVGQKLFIPKPGT